MVSLPTAAARVDGGKLLPPSAAELWYNWQECLLLPQWRDAPRIRPFSDPSLVNNGDLYAEFLVDLWRAGLIDFVAKQQHTVGFFFVHKKDGRLRLILDTRNLNQWFKEPAYSQLPTAAVWSQIALSPEHTLSMAQVDVDNAFYRVMLPPGMSSLFILPKIRADRLVSRAPELAAELPHGGEGWVCPRLKALAMEWSWSLFSCLKLVD